MFNLLSIYNKILKSRPLLITSISSGICYCAGDYIAQTIEKKQNKRNDYDYKRLAVFTTFGTFAGGPIYYAWFNKIHNMPIFIENIVKWNEKRILAKHFSNEFNSDMNLKTFAFNYKKHIDTIEKPVIRSKTILVAQIYADQFIFSVIYPIFFMITTGVMLDVVHTKEKFTWNSFTDSIKKAWINVKDKYFQIYVADCAFWPLAQMANFAFIPPHLQPIFVNILNIGWNTFLSYTSQGH